MSKFVVDDGCRCAVGICTELILTKLSYLLSNRSIRTEQRLFQLRLPHFLYRTKNKAMRDDQKTLIIYNE